RYRRSRRLATRTRRTATPTPSASGLPSSRFLPARPSATRRRRCARTVRCPTRNRQGTGGEREGDEEDATVSRALSGLSSRELSIHHAVLIDGGDSVKGGGGHEVDVPPASMRFRLSCSANNCP